MYIIDDTFFQSPNREIPNLNEADSKAFAQLEFIIDRECRLFMQNFLTDAEIVEFDSYLVNGLFPIVTTGIPQKWIDLVNGKDDWKGLVYTLGTSKNSLLADLVYYHYLVNEASYMTGVGDAKANPKGASLVNPTQRIVTVWNDFVSQYQGLSYMHNDRNYSLVGYLNSLNEVFDQSYVKIFCFKNQIGL